MIYFLLEIFSNSNVFGTYGKSKMRYLQKIFEFQEYQKHPWFFNSEIPFIHIAIKHISNFVKEDQIYDFCLILNYSNNII